MQPKKKFKTKKKKSNENIFLKKKANEISIHGGKCLFILNFYKIEINSKLHISFTVFTVFVSNFYFVFYHYI